MKYPITPDYLASAPNPIVKLYADLERTILEDICRRFRVSGEATESAVAQIKLLQERGISLGEIEKVIKKTLNLSTKELNDIIERAVERNKKYYDDLITKADIVNAEFKGLDSETAAIRAQTRDELVNITQSLGFAVRVGREVEFMPIAKTYQKVLDDAAMEVSTGAIDYNTAIRNAVKRLTDSGLQTVDYASGWHNRIDVAARRAIMTGVSQLSSQYAEQAAAVLETDYREITAHAGARDTGTGWQNHKSWQGKVYSIRAGDKYPSIYSVCGWGEVDGLEGANCRHHHFPFVDGVSERTYTDEQLKNIDPPPFEYQGKTYTAYEATQKQRQIEAAMRKCKREIIGYEAAGQTDAQTDSSVRLRRLSNEYKAFSKAANLRTQPERARVAGFDTDEAAKAGSITAKKFKEVLEKAEKSDKIVLSEDMEYIIAEKPFSAIQPLRRKLSDRAVRRWYNAQDAKIPRKIAKTFSLEDQARQACSFRNQNRTHARELMRDQKKRRELDLTDPNRSFEDLLADKMKRKGITREEAVADILRTATKTRKSVNKQLGLG